ncbi:MAG: DNA-protecting protein DprA [Armatimonadetes bacterium]|nr:DNA-protecting protein DprA [Armatimonadota bacterium]
MLAPADAAYPAGLRNIYDPPPVLYLRGRLVPEDVLAVAVVGTRRPTPYGLAAAERIAGDLARAGLTVVSGLARGIDGAAHRAALRAGGRTVAVLGCGVDVAYPPEHRRLIDDMVRHGAVLSEFPPGTPPRRQHFPRRNRLISGLSLGVVVVEGAEDSGALITADFALDQGREVFAVPGPIFAPQSRGPHWLIAQGARLVADAADILEELGMRQSVPGGAPAGARCGALSGEEAAVLARLSWEPTPVDRIVEEVGRPIAEVTPVLLALELRGLVQQVAGQRYVLRMED